MFFSAMMVTAPLLIGVADRVPTFDVNPTCGTAETRTATGEPGADVCRKSEQAARDDLAKAWDQFPAADRTRCVQLATMTQMPSYVQVLTCLEMARDARQLEAPRQGGTVGSAPGGK